LNKNHSTYNYLKTWNKISFHGAIPIIIIPSLLISLINVTSLFSFVYYLILSIALYVVVFKKIEYEVIFLFGLYSLLTVILFGFQYLSLPQFIGFSGGVGIGTDDCRYFVDVASITFSLPEHCYAHSVYGMPNYSNFIKALNIFEIHHPLDILFINVFSAVFLTLFTREFAREYFKNTEIAFYAFIFVLICPFIMSNSLILIRDGWTATLFIGSLYFLIKGRYTLLIIFLILLFYIRIASGAMSLMIILIIGYSIFRDIKINQHTKPLLTIFVIGIVLLTVGVSIPFVVEYMVNKNIGGSLLREEFLISYYIEGGSGRDNPALIKLMSMPAIIRIPASTLFFILLPLFSPGDIIREGIFIPRSFLASFLYPLMFLIYFKFMVQGFISGFFRKKNIKIILLFSIFILCMVILSQWSLQPRHKTMMMPLFYIIVASGVVYKDKLGKQVSNVLLTLFIMGQLMLLFLL